MGEVLEIGVLVLVFSLAFSIRMLLRTSDKGDHKKKGSKHWEKQKEKRQERKKLAKVNDDKPHQPAIPHVEPEKVPEELPVPEQQLPTKPVTKKGKKATGDEDPRVVAYEKKKAAKEEPKVEE